MEYPGYAMSMEQRNYLSPRRASTHDSSDTNPALCQLSYRETGAEQGQFLTPVTHSTRMNKVDSSLCGDKQLWQMVTECER